VLPGGPPGAIDEVWLAGAGSGPVISGNSAALNAFASAGLDAPTARIVRTERTSGRLDDLETAGGGGGATTLAPGGSGGGGGEGSKFECDAGAPGGHGFIALRPAA
jgi:hypothetical protein